MMRAQWAAADIEAQLMITSGCRPILHMLQYAKIEATEAIVALTATDPSETLRITRLQNEIRRFDDLCRWLRCVTEAGREADALLSEKDQDELIEFLGHSPEGRRELMDNGYQIGGEDAYTTE